MAWKDNYEKIDIKSNLKYLLPISLNELKSLYLSILLIVIFFIFSFVYSYSINLSFLFFSIILIVFSIFIYKSLISFFYFTKISTFYNKNEYHLFGFKQSYYLKDCILELNSTESFDEKKILFITFLGKKSSKKQYNFLRRGIFFYGNYMFLEYLKEYKTHKYITRYIITVFVMTSIAFYGLILELNSISINDGNKNFLFLFSIVYIIYIIYYSYSPYLDREQKIFFRDYIKGFSKDYFLVDDNLDRNIEDIKKSSDVLAIVFGVLFSLYIGLAYNTIYTVGVDIKKVSLDENRKKL